MTKKQWLKLTVMCDEWGRPPSLADVPLTYVSRKEAFIKQGASKKDINKFLKEFKNDKTKKS